MVGIQVQSGRFSFGPTSQDSQSPGNHALRVLVIGKFSGDNPAAEPLRRRKVLRVDLDTFDEIFERLQVEVQLPGQSSNVRFSALEDLHPDYLYQKLPWFEYYESLRAQLQHPRGFDKAVAQMQSVGLLQAAAQTSMPEQTPSSASGGLLDSLLQQSAAQNTAESLVEQLIRQAVAPHLQPRSDPRVAEYLAALDAAIGDIMRETLHWPGFAQLEARWRSLDMLQRRVDLDRDCHLHLLDLGTEELLADAQVPIQDSALWANLNHQIAGGSQFDLIVWDSPLSDQEVDSLALTFLGELAERLNAVLLCGANETLCGPQNFDEQGQFRLSDRIHERWLALRSQPWAKRVFVAAPRFMVRLPFGKTTSRIDSFAFDELPDASDAHSHYLWGNSAYLMLLLWVTQSRKPSADTRLANIPQHVTQDADGDPQVVPGTERYLTSSQVQALVAQGFTPLQSVKNSDQVLLQSWCAFAS